MGDNFKGCGPDSYASGYSPAVSLSEDDNEQQGTFD
jgi:hypothetical protein